jgi:hypothetical protein
MTQNTQNSDNMHKRIKDQSWLAQAGKSAGVTFLSHNIDSLCGFREQNNMHESWCSA